MSKHVIRVSSKGGPGSGHHGHAGRPGQRGGGRASGSRFGPGGVSGTPSVSAGKVLNAKIAKYDTAWHDANNTVRGKVKRSIVADLSEATGIPENEVNDFIGQWSSSSNDTDMRSLAIQEDASKALGVPLSEWQKEQLEKASRQDSRAGRPLMSSDKQQALIKEMHKQTQAELIKRGHRPGDHITLYRGIDNVKADPGSYMSYKGNAIESWSVSKDVADSFGSMGGATLSGATLSMNIPIENIIGTAVTGFGCLTEGEFVVVGNIPGQVATVFP